MDCRPEVFSWLLKKPTPANRKHAMPSAQFPLTEAFARQIGKFARKCLQENVQNARLNAMFVKTLTFLSVVLALAGSVRAGVISATWREQGCGESQAIGFNRESVPSAPSDTPDERQEVLLCPVGQAGLAGIATSGGGMSLGYVALSWASCALLTEPELCWRLHLDDDSLPCSPVLSGLLKPS